MRYMFIPIFLRKQMFRVLISQLLEEIVASPYGWGQEDFDPDQMLHNARSTLFATHLSDFKHRLTSMVRNYYYCVPIFCVIL